jgi:hypothetical protein
MRHTINPTEENDLKKLTGETVTPSIEIGTSRAPAFASALVPTVEVARAQIYPPP